jgi:hypothetical protein
MAPCLIPIHALLWCRAAELQHKVNHLGLQELTLLVPAEGAAATTSYIETFQSANQIPYPDNGGLPCLGGLPSESAAPLRVPSHNSNHRQDPPSLWYH